MKVRDLIAELQRVDGSLDVDLQVFRQTGNKKYTDNAVMEMNVDYRKKTLVMTVASEKQDRRQLCRENYQ
ncbi:MAG: hypothetical protein K2K02_06870 [Ruminococcus sp.]|nr:hypothetical protein [Ruminococcus sp.]